MTIKQKDFINDPTTHSWIQVIIYVVSVTVLFMSLKSDIRSLTERMTIYTDRTDRLTAAVNGLERDVIIMKTQGGVQ